MAGHKKRGNKVKRDKMKHLSPRGSKRGGAKTKKLKSYQEIRNRHGFVSRDT